MVFKSLLKETGNPASLILLTFSFLKFFFISLSVLNLADPYSLSFFTLCFIKIGSMYMNPNKNKTDIINKIITVAMFLPLLNIYLILNKQSIKKELSVSIVLLL